MQKKYIVPLNGQELHTVIKKLIGTSQKVRRAQVLLKADADGPGWTDPRIKLTSVYPKIKLQQSLRASCPDTFRT